MVEVPYEHRVSVAVLYIFGKAEFWWRGTGCDANRLPWHVFCTMLDERFNNVSEYELVEQIHNLKQVGSVEEYVNKFKELVSSVKRTNPTLPHSYYLSRFISGLRGHIKYQVQCHKSLAPSDAYWYAKRLEQAHPPFKKFNTIPAPHKVQKNLNKDMEPTDNVNQSIAKLKAAGKCFKCREAWVPGHAKVCKAKQLFSLVLHQDELGQDKVELVEDLSDTENEEFQMPNLTFRFTL